MGPNICFLVLMIMAGIVLIPIFFTLHIYFMFYVEQYHTSIYCFLSGIVSIIGLHLNLLLFRKKIDEWYTVSALEDLKVFMLFVIGFTFVGFGFVLTKALLANKGVTDLKSFYLSAIAASVSFILECWLFYLARWNKRYVELCSRPGSLNRDGNWRPFE